ncbi:MAG: alanine racemase [Pseudomonadota bacterium]
MQKSSLRPPKAPTPELPTPDAHPFVDVDLAALCRNFTRLAEASPDALPAAVVKCNGYGLGLGPVSRALAIDRNVRTFFVAHAAVGAELRGILNDLAPHADIFIFNGPTPSTLNVFLEHRLTPVLNTLDQAVLWARRGGGAPAALHIDTGINRLGIRTEQAANAAKIAALNITWVMSHFASAALPDAPKNQEQFAAFVDAADYFPNARKSLASTAGGLLSADYGLDMVRLGVGLYGVGPFGEPDDIVEPVATLRAPILRVEPALRGETAGYDETHRFEEDTVIATVALGYGDGFPRAASNRASCMIGGATRPIVGRISMDLTIIDAGPDYEPNNEADDGCVEIFGKHLPIEKASADCGTIGYELLTSLGPRVERRYFWDDTTADKALTGWSE